MAGGRDEAAPQCVHFYQRADFPGVTVVIGEHAPGEAGTGGGFHSDDTVISLAPDHFSHKGGDKSAQIGTAPGAADDNVRHHMVLVQSGLGLQADDGLVEHHLVQHASQHIAVALPCGLCLHGLGDGAAQAACGARVLCQDLSAHLRGVAGGGGDGGSVSSHNLSAEGFLLIGDFYHVDQAVQAQVGAGHGQGGAPLSRAGFCGDAFQSLLLGIVGLGDGGVELMASAGVVSLKFIVDLRRGLKLLLQAVGPHQGGRPVHFIEIADILRNGDISGGVVQFLRRQLVTEDCLEFFGCHGLQSLGVEQGGRFIFHVCTEIVPRSGNLIFAQIDLVGDFCFVAHAYLIFPG